MAKSRLITAEPEPEAPAPVEQTPETQTVVQPVTTISVTSPGIQLSEGQQASFDVMKTKSERIRFLASLGYKNGPISKYLSTVYGKLVRYQHVRNVLKSPLKKAS
jgi:hypothetical protein